MLENLYLKLIFPHEYYHRQTLFQIILNLFLIGINQTDIDDLRKYLINSLSWLRRKLLLFQISR